MRINLLSAFRRKKSGVWVLPTHDELTARSPGWHHHIEFYDELNRLRHVEELDNLVTRQGATAILNSTFLDTNIKTTWYQTQFKNNYTPLTTDTAASPGYTEIVYTTDVSQTVRPTMTLGSPSTGADAITINNSGSVIAFNMLTSISLYGLAVVSVNTGGGASDVLYGEAVYSTAQAVQNGYTVNVTTGLTVTAG